MTSSTARAEHEPGLPGDLETLIETLQGNIWSTCLVEIADLKVADALGDVAQTPAELADKVGANANALGRVMRLLATRGIFEDLDGRFRHTASSRLLRADHPMSMRGMIRLGIPTRPFLCSFGHTMRTGRPAVEALEPGGIWAYLVKNPEMGRIFDEGMTSRANAAIAGIIQAYDFSRFATIVDVGGGQGHLIRAVLEAAPKAKGILFDLPHVIDGARGVTSDRLAFAAGNFFKDALPAGDAYLLMSIIHDWDDQDSVAILRALRKVAAPDSRLLLFEMLMPETPQPHSSVVLDVLMMAYAMGQERKRGEYGALLEAAGFRLEQVIPTAGPVAILEATPA